MCSYSFIEQYDAPNYQVSFKLHFATANYVSCLLSFGHLLLLSSNSDAVIIHSNLSPSFHQYSSQKTAVVGDGQEFQGVDHCYTTSKNHILITRVLCFTTKGPPTKEDRSSQMSAILSELLEKYRIKSF